MLANLNPFNWSGPEFLQLYGISLAIVSAIAIAWRLLLWIAPRESKASQDKPLNVWELAYLRGGNLAVAQTAVVELFAEKLIEPDDDKSRLVATTLQPKNKLPPVPNAILSSARRAKGLSVSKMAKEVGFECNRIRERLEGKGYLNTWGDRFWKVWPGLIGFGLLIVAGLTKTGLGIYRDKPVGFLIILMAVTVLVWFVLSITERITAAGVKALNDSITDLKKYEAKLLTPTKLSSTVGAPHDHAPALPVWTFAVLGLASAESMLDPSLATMIRNRGMTNPDSGSGCSGGSGCGGGGGGGGCGGGGGGCGGCGS